MKEENEQKNISYNSNNVDYAKIIGDRVVQYRRQTDLCQEDFAKFLGIPKPTLGGYEQRRHIPSLSFIVKLANGLNLTLDQLLYRENKLEYRKTSEDEQILLEIFSQCLPENRRCIIEAARGIAKIQTSLVEDSTNKDNNKEK